MRRRRTTALVAQLVEFPKVFGIGAPRQNITGSGFLQEQRKTRRLVESSAERSRQQTAKRHLRQRTATGGKAEDPRFFHFAGHSDQRLHQVFDSSAKIQIVAPLQKHHRQELSARLTESMLNSRVSSGMLHAGNGRLTRFSFAWNCEGLNMSKSLIVAAGILTASMSAAMAADMRMPVKAPPIVDPPFSWSGVYVGGNAGYSWGRARTDQTDSTTTSDILRAFVVSTGLETSTVPGIPGTFPIVGTPVTTAGGTSARSNVDGFVGGVQAGYNWQLDKYWVVGLEADFQGSAERGSVTICSITGCPSGSALGFASTRLDWFGTVRGRVGWLPVERVLLYATGGLAYGSLRTDYLSGINSALVPLVAGSSHSVRVGYALGAGIEGAIDRHWTAKLEYLFLGFDPYSTNLGTATVTTTGAGILVSDNRFRLVPQTTATNTASVRTRFYDNLLRIGINYKL